jgi:8-oxo-dGTP pyrophosphatase MutT (NUDIX family)
MKKVVVGIVERNNQNGEKEWLLVSSANDFGKYTGYYYPPGGHIEEDETEEVALTREIKEELNLDARPIARLAISSGDVPEQQTYWWSCGVDGEMKVDPELSDISWFTQKRIQEGTNIWPATKKFFESYVFNPTAQS